MYKCFIVLACVLCLGTGWSQEKDAVMRVRGNVRYGPSTDAPVIITLMPGTAVTVLGQVPGREGWYKIRFPRAGHAWMHDQVLQATEDPAVLRVLVDGANVRSDATTGSEMVAQLSLGDTVEWVGGRKVGNWYAVYPPKAVAYAYHTVIDFKGAPPSASGGADSTPGATASAGTSISTMEALWQQSLLTYQSYKEQLRSDPEQAIGLNWKQLSEDLKRVEQEHETLRTKLLANKLRNQIRRVVAQSLAGQTPSLSGGDSEIAKHTERAGGQRDKDAGSKQHEDIVVLDPPKQNTPTPEEPTQDAPATTKQPGDATAAGAGQSSTPEARAKAIEKALVENEDLSDWADSVEGYVTDQAKVPELGVRYCIMDRNSTIKALLTVPEGSDVDLKPYFWRLVVVRGSQQLVDHQLPPELRGVPLLEVEAIRMGH